MNILALLLPVIFVPGFLGASLQPGWALMSCTLPILCWKGPSLPATLQLTGVALIGYALLSIYWSPNWHYAVQAVWPVGFRWCAAQ